MIDAIMPRKRTKGALVLAALMDGAVTTADLFVNIALEPLRHSYKGNPALLRGKDFSLRDLFTSLREEQRERHKFSNLLANLKRDRLITFSSTPQQKGWLLSDKGRAELNNVPKQYQKHSSQEIVVVSYDIPQKHRADRDWLRGVLKFLDFKMLHQSVWIGKVAVPEELLNDLRSRKISDFVHMFTIGKEGTLDQLL